MATTSPTLRRRRTTSLNRLENRAPGRVAFVVYRTRGQTRRRAQRSYRLLSEWLERRQELLGAENGTGDDAGPHRAEPDDEFGAAGDVSTDHDMRTDPRSGQEASGEADSADAAASAGTRPDRPSDDWTKGRLYELARTYDISGRSKLNKVDLLDAVLEEWDERNPD